MARKVIERNIAYDDERKKYYVTFNYGNDETGKQIIKRKAFNSKTEARKALREFEGNKVKGNVTLPSTYTVGQWLDYWLENVIKPNREETTWYAYSQMIKNHLKPFFGKINIQNLRPVEIQKYYKEKLTKPSINGSVLSAATVKKHHNLLKTAMGLAVKQGILLRNPLDMVEPPVAERQEVKFYTPEQMTLLLEKVEGTRLEVAVKLISYLGLRREEACGLSWDNVDFENKVITIKNARTQAGSRIVSKGTKNQSSERTPYMNDDLEKILREEKQRQIEFKKLYGSEYIDSNLVLVWENGKPYRPNYLSAMFTNFIKKSGLEPITLHGLRHSFASTAHAAGLSVYEIGKSMGHSTPSTTLKVYTHFQDKTHEDIIKTVESMYKKDTKENEKK